MWHLVWDCFPLGMCVCHHQYPPPNTLIENNSNPYESAVSFIRAMPIPIRTFNLLLHSKRFWGKNEDVYDMMVLVFHLLVAADLWARAAAPGAPRYPGRPDRSARHDGARPSPRQRSQRAPRAAGPAGNAAGGRWEAPFLNRWGRRQPRLAGLGVGVPLCEGEPGCAEDRAVRGESGCERGRAVMGAGLTAALVRAWSCTSWRSGGEAPWPCSGPAVVHRAAGTGEPRAPLCPPLLLGEREQPAAASVACCVRDGLAQFRGRRSPLAAGFQVFIRLSAPLSTSGPQPRSLGGKLLLFCASGYVSAVLLLFVSPSSYVHKTKN